MSDIIIPLNKNPLKNNLKDYAQNNVEETLNALITRIREGSDVLQYSLDMFSQS